MAASMTGMWASMWYEDGKFHTRNFHTDVEAANHQDSLPAAMQGGVVFDEEARPVRKCGDGESVSKLGEGSMTHAVAGIMSQFDPDGDNGEGVVSYEPVYSDRPAPGMCIRNLH